MTENDLEAYFGTLKLAQEAIGVRRENKKHLLRLEKLKELLLSAYDIGCIPTEFEREIDMFGIYPLLERNEDIRKVWDRDNKCLCSVPGRPEVKFDEIKARKLAKKHNKAPNVETLSGHHVKSIQETGIENLSLTL